MSATMISSSTVSTTAGLSTARRQPCRRIQHVRASYRPTSGFNAHDAFQQAARQFAQFQKQQQRAASQQRPQNRGDSARTEAFRSNYGPFQWNFDAEQMSKFMNEMDRAFGGDGSNVPSADSMQDAATCLYFPADLRESSAEYKYLIDLPGVPKSDIKVKTHTSAKVCCSQPCIERLLQLLAVHVYPKVQQHCLHGYLQVCVHGCVLHVEVAAFAVYHLSV